MSDRDEFERFVTDKFFDIEKDHIGYTSWATAFAWKVWQDTRAAARATPQQAVPTLTDEQIEELWRAYQLGQVSADHTAKEVFFEVMKINLRAMLVTSPAALTDEQILHMAEGIKFDDEDGAENLVAFVRKLLAAAPPFQEPQKAPQRYQD